MYGSDLKITKIDFFVLLGSSDLTSVRNYHQHPLENPIESESVSKRILNYDHVKIFNIIKQCELKLRLISNRCCFYLNFPDQEKCLAYNYDWNNV